MRVALICNNARLAQVVLYTLRANGIKPLLICNQRTAASLRSSRLVAGIMFFGDPQAERAAVVDAINRHNRRAPIDLVMSSDVDGLLLLSDIAGEIDPAVFPMSPRAVLERLNNKWTFRALCEELDLSAPPTLSCSSATRLDVDQVAREIGFPAVVKPVAKWASIGMRVVRSAAELRDVISDLEAAPEEIVIQTYIGGCDVGMGLFARSGKVTANCTFFCGDRDAAEFVDMPVFRRMGEAITAATSFTGVANFDARLDGAGRFWLLECNPRFFMRLGAARMCGLDLLNLPGAPTATMSAATGSYYPRGDILSRAGIWRAVKRESPTRILMQGIIEAMADPMPLVLRRFGYDKLLS